MDVNEFSFKELYSCRLKSTYNIEVAGKIIEPGEVIADFDKIQIANFNEIKSHIAARGGYMNEPQVVWDATQQLNIEFTQGVFSKTQFAILNNSKYLEPVQAHIELIGEREKLETDIEGKIQLKQIPHCDVYVYDGKTGARFDRVGEGTPYWKYNGGKEIQIVDQEVEYRELIVDYCFQYTNATSILKVGKEFTNSFLQLEGKTRVKDDETGKVKTAVLRIPKLKLMSDLSIRVGKQANPQVGHFRAIAYPAGSQGNKEAMRLIFLDDDIDSDM